VDVGEPGRRYRARASAASRLDEAAKAQIYRRSRTGVSVDVLAAQFGLSRPRVQRVINEMRARRILEAKLEFIADPSFEDPAAVAEILGPDPEPPADRSPERSAPEQDLPAYLASLYESRLLSREQEIFLFRKMNYLKYQAHRLRAALDPDRCDARQLDAIEGFQTEALAVKNQIIRANLRLVVSIAKKHIGPSNNLFELVSDGNMSLIRAVEKFDVHRGFRFSTYASWAIMKNFARSLREANQRRDRFVSGQDELLEAAADPRGDDHDQEHDHRQSRETVRGMLGRLEERERRILIGRYGIGGDEPKTLEQIGRELGVTKERVRQIETRAREKLRKIAVGKKLDLPFD
jgi:RNA polymerase primary sigma factor